ADYRHPTQPTRGGPKNTCEKVARIRTELARYLPDSQAKVSGQPIRRNPDVIRVTVLTRLDEAFADAAFVSFIRDSNAALALERTETGWMPYQLSSATH